MIQICTRDWEVVRMRVWYSVVPELGAAVVVRPDGYVVIMAPFENVKD